MQRNASLAPEHAMIAEQNGVWWQVYGLNPSVRWSVGSRTSANCEYHLSELAHRYADINPIDILSWKIVVVLPNYAHAQYPRKSGPPGAQNSEEVK
jgi:hypothetical protein